MKAIVKIATPAVFAFAALSVNAQTIETDYPATVPAGPVVAAVAPLVPMMGAFTHSQNAPYLIQSNSEGPRVNPGYTAAKDPTLTRKEVQAQAQVVVQWDAPDRRS